MSGAKTEKATEQRKRKARSKGDVARSRDMNSAVATLGGLLVLGAATRQFLHAWGTLYAELLQTNLWLDGPADTTARFLRDALLPSLAPVAVILAASFVASLLTGMLQSGGFQVHAEALAIQPSRLNPVANMKQIFSTRSMVRLAKSLLPAAALTMMSFVSIRHLIAEMPVLSTDRLSETFSSGYQLALHGGWLMLTWAGVDYASEHYNWSQKLRMSKQEVREEMRDSAQNPQIKGRMRQIQQMLVRQRTKADISRASVVIMNPTHFAVALDFSFETMAAPTVLAKGQDLIALQMRDEARWAGVPIVENAPLARSLYRSVDVGKSIPFELYAAVAGVLAYLYRHQVEQARRNQSAGGK